MSETIFLPEFSKQDRKISKIKIRYLLSRLDSEFTATLKGKKSYVFANNTMVKGSYLKLGSCNLYILVGYS